MGYYTFFTLKIYEANTYKSNSDKLEERFAEKIFNEGMKKLSIDFKYDYFQDSMKWYCYEDDMKKLSNIYPNYIFKLYGDGEENDDLWKCIFYKNKAISVRAITTFPEEDLSKLGLEETEAPECEPENHYFFHKD